MAFTMSKGKLSVQTENQIIKLRQENAYLRQAIDELSRQKGAPSNSESNKLLLERILSLETLREKNSQQILDRDQEISYLRQQLRPDSAEVVCNLQAQLKEQRENTEVRERLFQSLKQETEEVKNKLEVVSAKCQDLENRENFLKSNNADSHTDSWNAEVIQDHLKDALEKNQQWLLYDQQREAYVRTVLSKCHQLEQQLSQAEEILRFIGIDEDQAKEMQQHYQKLVNQTEKEEVTWQEFLTEQNRGGHELQKERLKSAELLKQIQLSAKELEEEKRENQFLQQQLSKILRELRNANDKVARLESEKAHRETPSSKLTACSEQENSSEEDPPKFSSSTQAHCPPEEGILECPYCKAHYPADRYRELLLHLDKCLK